MQAETPMTSHSAVLAGSDVSDFSQAGSGRSREVTDVGEMLNNVDRGRKTIEEMRRHPSTPCALRYCGKGRAGVGVAAFDFTDFCLAGMSMYKMTRMKKD